MARAKKDEFPLEEKEFIRDRLSSARNELSSVGVESTRCREELERVRETMNVYQRWIDGFEKSFTRQNLEKKATQKELKSAHKSLQSHVVSYQNRINKHLENERDLSGKKPEVYAIIVVVSLAIGLLFMAVYTASVGRVSCDDESLSIPKTQVGDGTTHCPDGSDEGVNLSLEMQEAGSSVLTSYQVFSLSNGLILLFALSSIAYYDMRMYPINHQKWQEELERLEMALQDLNEQVDQYSKYFLNRPTLLNARKRESELIAEISRLKARELVLSATANSFDQHIRYRPSKS